MSPQPRDLKRLEVDRLTILGGEKEVGLNTLGPVRPRSERYRPEALDRAIRAPLRNRHISVLAPEDFVLFKLLSTRDLDLEDVRSVLRRSGRHVDRDLIEREVGMLAMEISDHDVSGWWRQTRA